MNMLRVVFADLRTSYRNWLGAFLVIAVSAFFLSVAVAGSQTASAMPGDLGKMLTSFTTPSAVLTLLTVMLAVNTVSVLAVASQRRQHALWQLLGILPSQVSLIVIVQVFSVTVIATGLGTAIGAAAVQPTFDTVFDLNSAYIAPPIKFDAATWGWTTVFLLVAVAFGGIHAGYRAGRVPLIESVGRRPEGTAKVGKTRLVFIGVALLGTSVVSVFLAYPGQDSLDGAIAVMVPLGILFSCLLTISVALLAPLLFPLLLHGWTSIIPARASTTWYLARSTSRAHLTQSSSAITPLMIAAALSSSLFTIFMMAESAQSSAGIIDASHSTINSPSIFTVLAAPLVICAVAVAVVVYMTSREREREHALLIASGGTAKTIIGAAVLEAFIYVVTAAIAGIGVAVALGLLMLIGLSPFAVGMGLRIGIGYALGTLTVGLVLVTTAVVAPSLSATRLRLTRVLSEE